MGIKILPMEWRSDGKTEAKAYGGETLPGSRMVEDTRKNIDDILKMCRLRFDFVPLDPCNLLILPQSEAGCRILIDALLMHLASTLETDTSGVVIVPEFRVNDMLLGTTEDSFGGVVDYMLVYGNKAMRGQCVRLLDPVSNFTYIDRIIKSKASLSATLRYTNCSSATSTKRSPKIFSSPLRLFLKRRWLLSSRHRTCNKLIPILYEYDVSKCPLD